MENKEALDYLSHMYDTVYSPRYKYAISLAICALKTVIRSEYNKWNDVNEILPEDSRRVIVYIPNTETKIDTDRIVENKWVRWGDKITHWHELPNAPK